MKITGRSRKLQFRGYGPNYGTYNLRGGQLPPGLRRRDVRGAACELSHITAKQLGNPSLPELGAGLLGLSVADLLEDSGSLPPGSAGGRLFPGRAMRVAKVI